MHPRILWVGNDPCALEAIRSALEPHGHRVVGTSSGTEALLLIAAERVDLVLLDTTSPNIDPLDLIRMIRVAPRGTTTPLIVMAERSHAARARALEVGADELVDRPIEGALLVVRVEAQLRLRRLEDELGRRSNELGRILREHRGIIDSIVHDLRNPLSIVYANLCWAADHLEGTEGELVDALDDAGEALRRLQTMIEDMVLVARLERPDEQLNREWIKLGDLLDDVVLRHEDAARARNVSLHVAVEEHELELRADPTILRRVFDSMIESSLMHTPSSGRVELSAWSGPPGASAPSSSDIEIAVRNTGAPLPPEERVQLAVGLSDVRRQPSGIGLKLYFCRRAIEAHHGELDLVETDEWPTSLVARFPAAG